MSNLRPLKFITLGILLSLNIFSKDNKHSNIIFILADDLGYMDIAAYASKIKNVNRSELYHETPNLDKLIDEGIMFTQAYATHLCSPSRSSIITGKHASRLGFMTATPGNYQTHYNQGKTPPQGFYKQDGFYNSTGSAPWPLTQGITNIALPRDEVTFAEAMYNHKAAFIGKWHLGGHGSKGYSPSDQGFQEIAWFDAGGSPYFNWRRLWDKKKKVHNKMAQPELQHGKSGQATGEDYLSDDLTEQACNYIRKSQKSTKPFLLYFCHFAVHTPLQAKKKDIQYFVNKSTRGWNGHQNPTYAAMLKSLDDSIGDMLKTLKETNQLDNTIIMFISDNGGIKRPDKDGKATISNNTPLKGEKALLYEGGIRVPFFVWQPEKFKASSCDRPVDINDIFPTLLELGQYPLDQYKTYGDGQSLVPILSGSESHNYKRDTFHWHYPFYVSVGLKKGDLTAPRSAIRHKDWKLILNWEGKLELYNIENDLEEKHNLVNQEPERTQKLFKQLTSWINKTVEKRYIPIQNSAYKKHLNTAREFHDIFSDYDQTWPQGRSSRVKSKN